MTLRQPIRFLLLLLLMALLSIACQTSLVELPHVEEPTPTTNDCRIVEHEMGTTEVCGQPQRVVALSPHILDSILSLGVQPFAYAQGGVLNGQRFDQPEEQIPYLGRYVTTQPINLGSRRSPSLERLVQSQPDVILGENWHLEDQYEFLSQISPTLLFSDVGENGRQHWRYNIQGIAEALGREDQAEALLTRYSEQIAIAREKLAPVVAAYPRVLAIAPDDLAGTIYFMEDSTASNLLREIGFEIVTSEASSLLPNGNLPISVEAFPQIETDLIFVMAWSENWSENEPYPQEKIKQQWGNNPLLSQMPAFKDGRILFVDYFLWASNTRGPITDQLILEKLPQMLLPLVNENG
ncbi:ABC transporter substrate-binding protein [Vacuolonema iberomarrocanum]|uniref:ABC transporter substrate-binding protein n=1 Tax=Vacuolonema iberomarrocanum TaxID=3454632 RepID=UPI001A047492|nr:iron-siderophore ABC transporter substrate-binding protein [filamentous cyanobacterium LEGE 07170]